MDNAKLEYLDHTSGLEVMCATIMRNGHESHLKVDYSEVDLSEFLTSLDYFYDSGYGGQELYGTIWYKDGTWSDRGEYDGSEWWQHHSVPDIPTNLLK